jgi:hypothetical protein
VIYQSLLKLSDKKKTALSDLAAYANDSVRYKRRLRFLRELATYELNLIESFENFITENPEKDFDEQTLKKIRESIDLLTLLNS